MHILVTRPKDDAEAIKFRLEALGHTVSLAPLLDIVFEPIPNDTFDGAAAIVATSRNGLRALAASAACADASILPLFAVGPATAEAAREIGFANVIVGPGTARALVPVILAHPAARKGKLYHLAGDRLAFDLSSAIRAHGIDIGTLVVYRSVAAKTLPPPVVARLQAGEIDAVILMSPRTAQMWASLVTNLPVKAGLTGPIHICLSRDVERALRQALPARPRFVPPRVEVAARPNGEEILALVNRLAANSGSG